jgi:phosphoenolpyruvate carboxylase
VSRFKPTVQSEAQRGTLVVSAVLWRAVPSFLRKLDAEMRSALGEGRGLPLDAAPLKFGSWMGGDRDGNPNVTSNVTREVALANRIEAGKLIMEDLRTLHEELSITKATEEVGKLVGGETREVSERIGGGRGGEGRGMNERDENKQKFITSHKYMNKGTNLPPPHPPVPFQRSPTGICLKS